MKNYIITIFIGLFLLFSCKTSKPFTLEMKEELKIMINNDQEIQRLIMNSDIRKRDSLKNRKTEIFKKNHYKVKGYYKNHGFPGIKENGTETSHFFWLIVQHCDEDVKFQMVVLKDMKRQIKYANADKIDFAYLYDRVKKNMGHKQYYGTQISFDSKGGSPYPYNLKDPLNVNKRRFEIGLGTLEEYIKEISSLQKRKDIKP
jgi:hypothetical protein